jgi:hypothetical protein
MVAPTDSLSLAYKRKNNMFFYKGKKNTDTKLGKVVIIGTSPLAFVLADVIQNNNYDVSILTSKLEKQTFNHTKPFCFKYSNAISHQSSFSFIEDLSSSPDYCILASSLDEISSDFLLLQNLLLKDVPLINFTSCYSKKLTNKQIIKAFFKGWLQRDKNNIFSLDRSLEIVFSINKSDYSLSNIFSNQHMSVSYNEKSFPNFWEQITPFLIANLLLLKNKQSLSEMLPDKNIRKQIDAILKEISSLAAKSSEKFDSSKALATIYAIPSGYKGDIHLPKSFNNLVSTLTETNHFDTPYLHNLIVSASNNIIV